MAREAAEARLLRLTAIERPLWARGGMLAGIDEVGRGPLAGPVVAACISLEPGGLIPGVDDSKKLSPKRREALHRPLCENARYLRLGWVPADEIDRINILAATRLAMELAAEGAEGALFLVDAMEGLRLPGECRSIVHGDALSYLIAAASVVAKVERDRYMMQLHEKYPEYGFDRNKGYGTAEHIRAIERFGPCPEHRRTFISRWCR
ncbi:MAG: ribonuclease HII [Clostridiales bacterium]|nr:ribonuclease HII [Clostridiales bacterium]